MLQWYIPKRYILALLGFFGLFNVYAMRVNLSVAMVAMVNNTNSLSFNETRHITECSSLLNYDTVKNNNEFKGVQYNWDSKAQGLILGSFFYGYIVTQIPGGILSEKFGAKWLYGVGVLMTAILTLVTPLAASQGTAPFIAVRIAEGIFEGVTFPAITVAISRWSPREERSRISTIVHTGSQMGNIISMPVSGWLCSTHFIGGWPSVFYVFGTIGCLWFVLWAIMMHETPSSHPTISEEELTYIQQHKEKETETKPPIPWNAVLTSLPMWAVTVAHFGHNFGFVVLMTEMPTYLSGILHFDIKSDGALSALPYIVQALTAWIVSFLADRMRRSNRFSITTIRKTFNSIGLLGPAICLLGVTVSGCRKELIVALFSLGMAFNGFIYSGFNVTHVDMSPDFSGTLFGLTNAVAAICGIIAPMIVGYFTTSGATIVNWKDVFYLTAAIYIAGAVFYAVFASAEVQPWGVASNNSKEPLKEKSLVSKL